jgi:hypothetical protein
VSARKTKRFPVLGLSSLGPHALRVHRELEFLRQAGFASNARRPSRKRTRTQHDVQRGQVRVAERWAKLQAVEGSRA